VQTAGRLGRTNEGSVAATSTAWADAVKRDIAACPLAVPACPRISVASLFMEMAELVHRKCRSMHGLRT
jgi:hypothetical protein